VTQSQSLSQSVPTADFSKDIAEALRLQAEWDTENSALTEQLHFAQSLQNAAPSPIPRDDLTKGNDAQLQADALFAAKLAAEYLKAETDTSGNGDANFQFARKVWEEEERRGLYK